MDFVDKSSATLNPYYRVMMMAARFSVGVPFVLAVLICTLRKQHSSMYDSIEHFLQNYYNLVSIRYAFSEIKKITNDFKNELGEGGFGTIYKGKLRSGLLVFVKMMDKSKATWQDFINAFTLMVLNAQLSMILYPLVLLRNPYSPEKNISISRLTTSFLMRISLQKFPTLALKNYTPLITALYLTEARGTMGYMAPELFYKNIDWRCLVLSRCLQFRDVVDGNSEKKKKR
ncbi:hypothetical protein RJ639_004723 [Escallonia herrerae]|uniref:Uncharacterized protein n=1 Tax=Escallonia herrerae TaxID=1293975 RepID=A0AA88W4E5_9ASTE|nr:hypothetical protein RJ639_004723 [Escallonia herrerae]